MQALSDTFKITPENYSQFLLKLWQGQCSLIDLFTACNQLTDEKQAPLAAVLYQTWLKRCTSTHNHLVLFNLGVILFDQGDMKGAGEAYSQAISLDPNFLQPRFNLGLVNERLGRSELAIAQWLWIESHADSHNESERPLLLLALNNLGRHLEDRSRYAEATAFLSKSLKLNPNQPDVIHHWVFLRAKQCLWPVYESLPGLTEAAMRKHTSALAMISISEDPSDQLAAAQNYVEQKLIKDLPRLAPEQAYHHKKIRIGYCSSDLCLHPVAMLTVELFELHNRDEFELYAYDWSREDGSHLRQRVIKAFDHFHKIHQLNDLEAAQLIRSHEIDILIDLQGQTLGARANMLALRPAPCQITYLGLPATTGLPFIDYVIADRFLIPEEAQHFYSEKPLYLPDVYQVSDRQREVAARPNRSEYGLPEEAFVFCSFNNNYKYNPEMFACWMRILNQIPGSYLWLLSDNPWAEDNLRTQALAFNIDPQRLVFAKRELPAKYLARYALADLFLDTYPFNAGTTANDALWMGLPLLTRCGQTFASRMAGALLTAAKLDSLITYDLDSYEKRAIELASNPAQLKEINEQLAKTKDEGVLFDTPRFVSNLEYQLKALIGTRI